jgi:hypothetical protein
MCIMSYFSCELTLLFNYGEKHLGVPRTWPLIRSIRCPNCAIYYGVRPVKGLTHNNAFWHSDNAIRHSTMQSDARQRKATLDIVRRNIAMSFSNIMLKRATSKKCRFVLSNVASYRLASHGVVAL